MWSLFFNGYPSSALPERLLQYDHTTWRTMMLLFDLIRLASDTPTFVKAMVGHVAHDYILTVKKEFLAPLQNGQA